mgnify:CR=1 FL=1
MIKGKTKSDRKQMKHSLKRGSKHQKQVDMAEILELLN